MRSPRLVAFLVALAMAAFGYRPATAADCCQGKAASGDSKSRPVVPPPCLCPYWEIAPVGAEYIYYAEYFAIACSNPELIEIQGNYPLSPGCTENPNRCLDPSKRKRADRATAFEGVENYLKHSDRYELPAGQDGKGTACSELQFSYFISFQPDPNATAMRYAKVFAYRLDRAKRFNNAALKPLTIYVGLELEGPPPASEPTPFASCERMETIPLTDPCHLYRAVHRGTNPPMQIMLLTPKAAP